MSINDEEGLEDTEPGTIEENFTDNGPPDDEEKFTDNPSTDDEENNLVVEIDGFRIEEGVPVPSIRQRKSNTWHKIAESIKIGQSVPFEDKKDGAAFTSFLHKNGIPYTSRSEGEGMRVWKLRKQNKKEVPDGS